MKTALSEVQNILASITSPDNCVTPTLLYNEGWLVKLVLRAAATGIDCLPFQIEAKSRWFSEALLHSAFTATEGTTHGDGVIGHYSFNSGTKAGTVLEASCSQFIVCEAKMFSRLSPVTTRAKEFDQATRTVACMAIALWRSKRPIQSYKSLGFYVLAPASRIGEGVFSDQMAKAGIRRKLAERVAGHGGQPEHAALEQWLQEWALPLVEQMELDCYPWEAAIRKIAAVDAGYGASLHEFYQLCLEYNDRERRGRGANI